MIKVLLAAVVMSASLASPALANNELVEQIKPCIDEEIYHRTRPEVSKITVSEQVEHQGINYYYVLAETERYPWGFYVSVNGSCKTESSEFVTPDESMEFLPKPVAVKFIRKQINQRIQEIGFKELQSQFKAYRQNLSPVEVEVARDMGLL